MNSKATRTAWNVLIALVMIPLAASLAQTTYYVNGSCGHDAGTGTNPACRAPDGPKPTIQPGIDVSVGGDTASERLRVIPGG